MPEHAARARGLTSIPSPAILPAFVARHTVLVAADAEPDGLALPADLRGAVAARQRSFLAGRYCARRALEALAPGLPPDPIGPGPAGEPLWPEGFVGSITHAGGFVSAAVARATDVRGVGIDTERLERFEGSAIGRLVMLPGDEAASHGLEARLRLPLVFAAKEAIFKCLYPLVGQRFWFEDAVLTAVGAGSFSARLTRELAPGMGPGLALSGRYVFDGPFVHTGVGVGA